MTKTTDDITAKYLLELLEQIAASLRNFGFKPQAETLLGVRKDLDEIIVARCEAVSDPEQRSED